MFNKIMHDFIKQEIHSTIETLGLIYKDDKFIDNISVISDICVKSLNARGKIIFAGNGGSAADSQHLAAELVSRLSYNRPALPAIAITTDTSALTAIGNDYGYEHVFSRQIEAVGSEGDVLFAISTSGNSPNIIKAIEVAKNKKIVCIGLTGSCGGKMDVMCDYLIKAPSKLTPKIQESHIVVGHIICSIIEERLFGDVYNPKTKSAREVCKL